MVRPHFQESVQGMFGKFFSRPAARGASVNTVIDNSEVGVGQVLSGTVHVTGGSVGQEVRSITVELVSRCVVEIDRGDKVFAEVVLAEGVFEAGWIEPDAEAFVEFDMEIPAGAPISVGSTEILLRTHLDIEGARDSQDHDPVVLLPTETMAAVLNGTLAAGFELVETEVEYQPHRDPSFVQEFDFRPLSVSNYGIDEVEISMRPVENGVEVALTVDRRGGFFTGGGERVGRFIVRDEENSSLNMAEVLRREINRLR